MEARFIDICENVAHRLESERLVVSRLKLKPEGDETEISVSLAALRCEAPAPGEQRPNSVGQDPYPCFQRVFGKMTDYQCEFEERVQHRRWSRIVRLRVATADLKRFALSAGDCGERWE